MVNFATFTIKNATNLSMSPIFGSGVGLWVVSSRPKWPLGFGFRARPEVTSKKGGKREKRLGRAAAGWENGRLRVGRPIAVAAESSVNRRA